MKGHVLGTVSHHFVKKENQARGAPHYHMVLWIEGAPTIGKYAPAVVLKWIQERISCRIPDEATNPELHQLVTRYQMHKCSSYCKCTKKGFRHQMQIRLPAHGDRTASAQRKSARLSSPDANSASRARRPRMVP